MYSIDLFYMFLIMIFSLTILTFISVRKHLLLTLLTLEFLVLIIFVCLVFYMNLFLNEYYMLVLYLTFTVCEGAVGLGVLVSLIRCHGNDNVYTLSFLLW